LYGVYFDLAPIKRGGDKSQNCLHDMHIVGDAQLVWDGEQERVRLGDRLVFPELLDEDLWLSCVATTEDRPCVLVKEADCVLLLRAPSEVSTITVIHQREDTAADGNARSASVAGFLPCCAKGANLCSLLDVKRLTGFIEFES